MTSAAEKAAKLLGSRVVSTEPLHGGNLSEIIRIALADGRMAIVKTGPSPRTEAAMLGAIRDAGVPAPEVLAVDDEALILAEVPADGSISEAWADLGIEVARLHAAKGERYGWDGDYAFGAVRIENGWSQDWPSFWAERRLLASAPHVPSDLA